MSQSTVPSAPPLVQGQTWEQMSEGSAFRTGSRTITETDLVNFITAHGFTEPLFWDARHAAEANYRGRLCPGALTYCVAEGLVLQTNALHGTGMAFLHMELDVKGPVYVGDTLTAVVEVLGSRKSSRPGAGIVSSRVTVINQHDEVVMEFTPVRMIRGQDFIPTHPNGH